MMFNNGDKCMNFGALCLVSFSIHLVVTKPDKAYLWRQAAES